VAEPESSSVSRLSTDGRYSPAEFVADVRELCTTCFVYVLVELTLAPVPPSRTDASAGLVVVCTPVH
jgi:hypothetical protein